MNVATESLTPSSADLTVWGRHRLGGTCTQALVYLDGQPWSVRTGQSGSYRIRIYQPDGSELRHTVTVVERRSAQLQMNLSDHSFN